MLEKCGLVFRKGLHLWNQWIPLEYGFLYGKLSFCFFLKFYELQFEAFKRHITYAVA